MAARAICQAPRQYEAADKTASQLFLELLPCINAGTVRLLQRRRLVDPSVDLERRTSFGTGRDTVGHPPGCHDDLAVAVAAVLATTKKPTGKKNRHDRS